MERICKGTQRKYALNIKSEGFDMDNDPWTAHVVNGRTEVKCKKGDNAVRDSDGQWYIIVDTTNLTTGLCYLVVSIDIPDEDSKGGYRHEVLQQEQALFDLYDSKIPKVQNQCVCNRY